MNKAISLLLIATICFSQVIAFSPPHYSQGDSRWGSEILGFGPATIRAAGCLLTSVSSMLAGIGIKVNGAVPNPSNMNAWLKAHQGFTGDDYMWYSIGALGLKFLGKDSNHSHAVNYLNQGKFVILNVNNGHHYVLATGVTSTGFTVMDPGFSRTSYSFTEVVTSAIYSL